MRWKEPRIGDERTVRKFLWWPICLRGENRWLERVAVRQVYEQHPDGSCFWRWVEFLDGNESDEDEVVLEPPVTGRDDSAELDPEMPQGAKDWREGQPQEKLRVVKTSQAIHDGYAFEMLVSMGARAVPILLRMGHEDLAIVHSVLRKMPVDEAVAALTTALGDSQECIRFMAAELFCFSHLKPFSCDAVPALVDASRDASPNVREAALRAVGELAALEISVPLLIDALDDEVASVRGAAVAALGAFGSAANAAIPALTRMLDDDPVAQVRDAAKTALKGIRPPAIGE